MSRTEKPTKLRALSKKKPTHLPAQSGGFASRRFDEVLALIEVVRGWAEPVTLYWQIGRYIRKKIETAEWGDGVVDELAAAISREYPGVRGYTRRNWFRMRQLFDAYGGGKRVSPLGTQLPWTQPPITLSQTKQRQEREFYLVTAIKERWSKRELERQIATGAALRGHTRTKKVSQAVSQVHNPAAIFEVKNAYSLEFLSLAAKDDEVVEYALARTSSPTLVAEYQAASPTKALLRNKLQELYAELVADEDDRSGPAQLASGVRAR